MSEREEYPPGVPCWVERLRVDPLVSIFFYEAIFGWGFVPDRQVEEGREYYVGRIRGREIAGVGPLLNGLQQANPGWMSHICVMDVDRAKGLAIAAGGQVIIEPFDLSTAGRMAVLSDPTGAVFAIWQPRARKGARLVNEAGAWALNTLYTPDIATSARFYAALFGWKTEVVGDSQLRIFRLTGYFGGVPQQPVPRDVVAVMLPTSDRTPEPYWEVDFWSDDVDHIAAEVARLGGTVVSEPYTSGLFRSTTVADPKGAVFTVSKMMPR